MKITYSNVAMDARHQRTETQTKEERLEYWRSDAARPSGQIAPVAGQMAAAIYQDVQVTLSHEATSLQVHRGEISAGEDDESGLDAKARLEVSIMKLLVEQITGRRIRVLDPQSLTKSNDEEATAAAQQGADQPAAASAGFGLRYEYHEYHHESEHSEFQAQGTVKTADGREIEFNASLSMSREFTKESHLLIEAGDALKDPLVLNFEGNAAELTQRDFRFDIDMDGSEDQIAFVKSNSGFLALDKNNDGIINDGSELFGPTSGNGFKELAEYDSDGNQWIDENDPIYTKLRIWSRDDSGNQQLLGLGAKNVGAIYLGHVATPFEINNANNEQLGQVRSSGVFLKEDGEVATIQQVDLVV